LGEETAAVKTWFDTARRLSDGIRGALVRARSFPACTPASGMTMWGATSRDPHPGGVYVTSHGAFSASFALVGAAWVAPTSPTGDVHK